MKTFYKELLAEAAGLYLYRIYNNSHQDMI